MTIYGTISTLVTPLDVYMLGKGFSIDAFNYKLSKCTEAGYTYTSVAVSTDKILDHPSVDLTKQWLANRGWVVEKVCDDDTAQNKYGLPPAFKIPLVDVQVIVINIPASLKQAVEVKK